MAKSILQNERVCYFCGRVNGLEKHHVFAGVANRPISERLGLWAWICKEDHTGRYGVQYNKEKNLLLKQDAQRAFEKEHPRSEWMELIRKNYL
ncbi:MAG: hypothetical protein J6Y20_12435 [Lachnospiraceae bacterium]|nr:hypothetical protein [Lachnospiraceae bacterium]